MKTINGKQLKDKMEGSKRTVIDIDAVQDFKKRHIVGAVNIPYSDVEFVHKVEKKIANKNEEVILCSNPTVSNQVDMMGKKLEEAGFKNVLGHTLGEADWKKAGLKVAPTL